MELEFPVQVSGGISTEPEVRWWYVCNAEEVEQKGSTVVWYLILLVFSRPYTLECTQQALVSGPSVNSCTIILHSQPFPPFSFWLAIQCANCIEKAWSILSCKFQSAQMSTLSAEQQAWLYFYFYHRKTDLYLRPNLARGCLSPLSLLLRLLLERC